MWLQAIFGWAATLVAEAADFITRHWIGLSVLLALWGLLRIIDLLQVANSRLEEIAGSLRCIETYTDAMSADDRERQAADAEAEYFRNLSGAREQQAAES